MKYLFISSHLDDAEAGCGATIHKLSREHEIYYLGLSPCHAPARLEQENKFATKRLNIPPSNVFTYGLPVRYFHQYRQDILDIIIETKQKVSPDVVFTHSLTDLHQDHQVTAEESLRAFKHQTIFGYELPQNSTQFRNQCYFRVGDQDLRAKCEALKYYVSQQERAYMKEDFVISQATFRGLQAGCQYAESFEVVRVFF